MLLTTLGVLVRRDDSGPRRRRLAVQPAVGQPRGILGPLVRAADREWDLGIIRSTAVLAGLVVALAAALAWRSRSWPRWAGVGAGRARLRDAARPGRSPPGRPARRDRSLGLTRTTPRTRSSSPATSSSTATTRTGTTMTAPGSSASTRRRTTSSPDYPVALDALRLLPRHGADGGRVAARAGPVRRLPHLRAARDARAAPGRAPLPRRRCTCGSPPAPRSRRTRSSCTEPGSGPRTRRPARARARVRPAGSRPPGLGGGEPRRRARAEAVRARRRALLRCHAADDRRPAPRRSTEPAPPSPASSSPASCRSSSPTPARSGTTRSPTAPARTGSSATACRRSSSTPGIIDDRFDYYPFVPLALARLAAADGVAPLEPAAGRDALAGRGRLASRCSSCCSSAGSSRPRTSCGR